MALTYERTFRVRHYECDAYGHVNHANYVRYMQEAAMDASAAVGYDVETYEAMGRQWFVRETDIVYKRPLTYRDSVTVQTWVANFRRVRSRRMYRLCHSERGEVVAEGHSDWIFLDGETLRPATVPLEMIGAFFPEGAPAQAARPEPFPKAPPSPSGTFTSQRQVAWLDIDPAGHVNNAMYLAYCEDCVVQAAAAHGWPMSRLAADGIGIVARRYRIEYKEAAVLGDRLAVSTWASDLKRASAIRHYTITRVDDGQLLAQAHVLYVWIDLKTGQPARIPEQFVADFAPNIVET